MARKRANGEGTITQREDGRWMGQISLGYDPITGKRVRKTVYADSQRECRERLEEVQERFRDGHVLDSEMPLNRFLDQWLVGLKDSLAEGSYDRYGYDVAALKKYLGGQQLDEITGLHVSRMYQSMAQDGASATTRLGAGKRLRQVLAAAIQMGLVKKNAAQAVPLPRPTRGEIRPLTAEQVGALLDAARGHRLYALWVVAVDSGARIGELLALEWSDWNPATRELSITKTLQNIRGGLKVKTPKTKGSRRKVVLAEESVQALAEHLAAQASGGRLKTALVFANGKGGHLRLPNLHKDTFKPLLRAAGLPLIRVHDLRHTCATLLLMAGVNVKLVADRLGHANPTITLNTYAHVIPGMQHQAASVMGGILRGSKVAVNAPAPAGETRVLQGLLPQ